MDNLDITEIKVVPCVDSKFIAPSRVTFKQCGVERNWDYIKAHDSVSILILNTTRNEFVLVKQFRPALYMNVNSKMQKNNETVIESENTNTRFLAPFAKGVTYELCAGIVDKQIPLIEIAECEILEETGYKVPRENIQRLFLHCGVGFVGNQGTVYYAEVTDDMKVSSGGGNIEEGEFIELFYLPLSKAKEFAFNDDYPKHSSLVAAFSWYFMNH